jgi:ABC-2 type transport system permease protein
MAFLALARAGFRRSSSYRAATLAGIFTNTMFGFFGVAILVAALEAGGGEIAGYTRTDAITYTWMTQAMIGTLAIWGWVDLATRIQTGDIVTDLQRPIDLQSAYLSEDYGRAAYQLLARGIPPFLIGMIFYDLAFPATVGQWCAFVVSTTFAVGVSFGLRFIVNLLAFWVLDWRGLLGLSQAVATVASGFVVPLAFFPGPLERLLTVLPWASLVQVPVDIFLGKRTGATVASGLALQLMWAVLLFGIGRLLLQRAALRVVVQGG